MTEKIRDDIIKIYKMLTSPQGAYTYDANGNLTSVASKQYGYDLFNRLTSFSDGTTTASYTYNGDGQRMSKTVNGVTKYFVWNGSNVVLEYEKDSNGAIVNAEKYIYAPDGILAKITGGAVVTYAKDSKGSVNATLDANGNVIESLQYDAYGKRIGDNANSVEKFGYAGEYYDSETGLIYLRNRYYDPNVRIFITQDPAMDGSNWYSYCAGNPVMFVDPLGLAPTVMEAALIAEHIYDWNKYSDKEKRTISGWRLVDTWNGREEMKMGIYIRNGENIENPSEYVVAFKGTTLNDLNEWKNNAEQLLSSKSADMWDAINYAMGFVDGKSQEITFVGHSKGGAEAASAAVATNKNAMIFNPATSNLYDYGLNTNSYTADMTAFIVRGDIVNYLEGWFSSPIDKVKYLPQQHGGHWYEGWQTNTVQRILNHLMPSVKNALMEKGYR